MEKPAALDRLEVGHKRFSLVVASVATVGSLYFSLGMGLVPCDLCWYQRILMYPLVVVIAVGIWTGDRLDYYVLPFSVSGLVIAAYHNYLQMTPASTGACTGDVPCEVPQYRFFSEIVAGGVTIPQMSFTAFALITLAFVVPLASEYR